jgi:hypothetical protein
METATKKSNGSSSEDQNNDVEQRGGFLRNTTANNKKKKNSVVITRGEESENSEDEEEDEEETGQSEMMKRDGTTGGRTEGGATTTSSSSGGKHRSGEANDGEVEKTTTTNNNNTKKSEEEIFIKRKPARPTLGQNPFARGVPATPLLSDVMSKLRKASRALIDALAKGRDDAEQLFEKIDGSVEETKSSVHEIEAMSRDINDSLRQMCEIGLRKGGSNSKSRKSNDKKARPLAGFVVK